MSSKLLLVYASTEGQTAKIAAELARILEQHGAAVTLRSIDQAPDNVTGYRMVVLGGSVHAGRHSEELLDWAKKHAAALLDVGCEFFSVCLAAVSNHAEEREAARANARSFVDAANLHGIPTTVFAGALRYTQYGMVTKWMMRWIAKIEGGDTDTTRNFEYTNWTRVSEFAEHLADQLRAA